MNIFRCISLGKIFVNQPVHPVAEQLSVKDLSTGGGQEIAFLGIEVDIGIKYIGKLPQQLIQVIIRVGRPVFQIFFKFKFMNQLDINGTHDVSQVIIVLDLVLLNNKIDGSGADQYKCEKKNSHQRILNSVFKTPVYIGPFTNCDDGIAQCS